MSTTKSRLEMSMKKACTLLTLGLSFFCFVQCGQIYADESEENTSTAEEPYESVSFDSAFIKCVGGCFGVVETKDNPNLRAYMITGYLEETNHKNQNGGSQIAVLDMYCSQSGEILRGTLDVYWETDESSETGDLMNPAYVDVSNLRCAPVASKSEEKQKSEVLGDSKDVENSKVE